MGKRKTDTEKESLDHFLERVYGKGIIDNAANALPPRSREILNCPLSLDIALSGGIPDGSVTLITGRPKSGKTTICLELLKNAQLKNRPTFYINIERRCTPALLSTIKGLDLENLQVVPNKIETPLSAEDYLTIIERIIKDQKRAVIVVDSIAALSTMIEQQETIGSNKDMAGIPKILSSFFRRTQQTIDTNDIILIFISQVMTNREPRGPKYTEKGGLAIQYACSTWLSVSWVSPWDKNPEINAPEGHDIHIRVNASSLGRPLIPCILPLRYGSGIDRIRDVVTNCENLGFIEKSAAWYSIPSLSVQDAVPKFHGLANLSEFFQENPNELDKLETEIREIIFSKDNKNG